jgi:hypothetical protein
MFNKIKRINSQETDKVDSELNNARRECQEILNNINIVKGEHDKYLKKLELIKENYKIEEDSINRKINELKVSLINGNINLDKEINDKKSELDLLINKCSGYEKKLSEIEVKHLELNDLSNKLNSRSNELNELSLSLDKKSSDLLKLEELISLKKKDLDNDIEKFKIKKSKIDSEIEDVRVGKESIEYNKSILDKREIDINEELKRLNNLKIDLDRVSVDNKIKSEKNIEFSNYLKAFEESLKIKESEINKKKRELSILEKDLTSRNESLIEKEDEMNKRVLSLDDREQSLILRESLVNENNNKLLVKERKLELLVAEADRKNNEFDVKLEQLNKEINRYNDESSRVKTIEKGLEMKELELRKEKQDLLIKYKLDKLKKDLETEL